MTLVPGQPIANPGEYGSPRVFHAAANEENRSRYLRPGATRVTMPVFPLDARTLTTQAGITPPEG